MAKTPLQSSNHHVVPTRTYALTLLALVVLMLLTVWVAQKPISGFGPISGTVVNQSIALLIACIKAGLVVFIFMGVWWSTTLTKLWALTGFVWFTLIFMILGDYSTRGYEVVPGWDSHADTALPRKIQSATMPDKPLADSEINIHPRQ